MTPKRPVMQPVKGKFSVDGMPTLFLIATGNRARFSGYNSGLDVNVKSLKS
jgi:hypothetical protein